MISSEQPKHILFITLTNIGDVVITTVLLNRILKTYPNALVDVVVGPQSAPLFDAFPNLGELMVVTKKKNHGHYIDLLKKLRPRRYDVVVDLRTPLLGRLLKSKKKVIYRKKDDEHRGTQMAKLWPLSEELPLKPTIWLGDDVKTKVKKAKVGRPLIALAPTANWLGKQWPQAKFAELVHKLLRHESAKNAMFTVFGAPNERKYVQDLLEFAAPGHVLDLVGKTTLPEACAWIEHADLFIGNDSGLAHAASAVGTPTVTIFGPMQDKLYAPLSEKGAVVTPPMRHWNEVNLEPKAAMPRVMTDVEVKDVFKEAVKLLEEQKLEEPA